MAITYDDIQKANEAIRTTDIKGKDYAEVNQRIKAFRMVYPEGYIFTEMVSNENGVCIFRATVGVYAESGADSGFQIVLGTGTAYEKENSSFINKTSYIENCVPLSTQILTADGWKYYYQLKVGDRVLSANLQARRIEYCDVTAINIYENHPVLDLSTSRFHAQCTPQHKWVTRYQSRSFDDYHKTATDELKRTDKIVQNIDSFTDSIVASDVGKKLGWLLCDCEISLTKDKMPSTAYISQSKYVDEITALFGEPTYKNKNQNKTWQDNYQWVIPAKEVREILGRFNIATYDDLPVAMCKANLADVAGCLESMLLADGDSHGFSSTYLPLVEAVQIMCARLGISTSFIKSRMTKKSTRPIYTLGIKKTDGACVSEMKVKMMPPQDVWCPTTENGTWFMRQGSFVTLTSNCETSAVGRALGMAGFGIDTSVASYEEVQNAMANQDKKASPKQIEMLSKVYQGELLEKLLKKNNLDRLEDISMTKASELIKKLKK